jgi:hypothetical protein
MTEALIGWGLKRKKMALGLGAKRVCALANVHTLPPSSSHSFYFSFFLISFLHYLLAHPSSCQAMGVSATRPAPASFSFSSSSSSPFLTTRVFHDAPSSSLVTPVLGSSSSSLLPTGPLTSFPRANATNAPLSRVGKYKVPPTPPHGENESLSPFEGK